MPKGIHTHIHQYKVIDRSPYLNDCKSYSLGVIALILSRSSVEWIRWEQAVDVVVFPIVWWWRLYYFPIVWMMFLCISRCLAKFALWTASFTLLNQQFAGNMFFSFSTANDVSWAKQTYRAGNTMLEKTWGSVWMRSVQSLDLVELVFLYCAEIREGFTRMTSEGQRIDRRCTVHLSQIEKNWNTVHFTVCELVRRGSAFAFGWWRDGYWEVGGLLQSIVWKGHWTHTLLRWKRWIGDGLLSRLCWKQIGREL